MTCGTTLTQKSICNISIVKTNPDKQRKLLINQYLIIQSVISATLVQLIIHSFQQIKTYNKFVKLIQKFCSEDPMLRDLCAPSAEIPLNEVTVTTCCVGNSTRYYIYYYDNYVFTTLGELL